MEVGIITLCPPKTHLFPEEGKRNGSLPTRFNTKEGTFKSDSQETQYVCVDDSWLTPRNPGDFDAGRSYEAQRRVQRNGNKGR